MFLDLINHWFLAGNAHRIHSPFVFDFYVNVYKNNVNSTINKPIEDLRKSLKANSEILEINDFGAGSKINSSSKRSVKDIASKSLKSPFWSSFLYRIIEKYKCSEILELGTSLGITTCYLAKAAPSGTIYTLEGCSKTLEVAKRNFEKLNLTNIKPKKGNIDLTLPEVLGEISQLDFVLFDANHRLEPTLRYLEICLKKAHTGTIFVFDDIYWSSEMKTAWKKIVQDSRISLSIDLYQMGIVFFKEGVKKQHFVLK